MAARERGGGVMIAYHWPTDAQITALADALEGRWPVEWHFVYRSAKQALRHAVPYDEVRRLCRRSFSANHAISLLDEHARAGHAPRDWSKEGR